uniref:Uncharacterized protein n=1 Tax=Trichogramma kaykai TaxID=54128 RepID=A0ABD2WYL0_9HYME
MHVSVSTAVVGMRARVKVSARVGVNSRHSRFSQLAVVIGYRHLIVFCSSIRSTLARVMQLDACGCVLHSYIRISCDERVPTALMTAAYCLLHTLLYKLSTGSSSSDRQIISTRKSMSFMECDNDETRGKRVSVYYRATRIHR